MKQWNKTKEEVIDIFLDFSQSMLKCKKITLLNESINGKTAILTYTQTDICSNSSDQKQTVKLINENGWKIESIEFDL